MSPSTRPWPPRIVGSPNIVEAKDLHRWSLPAREALKSIIFDYGFDPDDVYRFVEVRFSAYFWLYARNEDGGFYIDPKTNKPATLPLERRDRRWR